MDRLSELLGYPPEALALISLCIVLGGIAKGIAGVGLPIVTLSIILTAGLMEPRDALAALVLPILVTNLWQAVRAGDLHRLICQGQARHKLRRAGCGQEGERLHPLRL